MYMALRVPESGRVHFAKLEGSMLESGELIATVSLEDPSTVHKVALSTHTHTHTRVCPLGVCVCARACRRSASRGPWIPLSAP